MEQKSLLQTLSTIIQELRNSGKWGTAHVYRSASNAFVRFTAGKDLPLREITPALLKEFEVYLRGRRCSWNTVSTYMKALRSAYNKAVDEGYAAPAPRLFRHVYTGVASERKRALEAPDIGSLLNEEQPATPALPPDLAHTLKMLQLMFLLRGIPFVDLVYLRKSDLRDNILRYRRRKTGRQLTVTLTPEALRLLDTVADCNACSPYLLPYITAPEGSEAAYREYQRALRHFNRQLAELRQALGGTVPVTYVGDDGLLLRDSSRHHFGSHGPLLHRSDGDLSQTFPRRPDRRRQSGDHLLRQTRGPQKSLPVREAAPAPIPNGRPFPCRPRRTLRPSRKMYSGRGGCFSHTDFPGNTSQKNLSDRTFLTAAVTYKITEKQGE
jgi:integrase